MQFSFNTLKRCLGAPAVAMLALLLAHPASASVCFTSGKVYMQQKVYDKAAYFLECARKGEPANIDALSLLAVARAEQRQYVSAGAAFQIGLDIAKKKNDQKKITDLERNRLAVNARLFNAGVKALSGSGELDVRSERTSGDASSPQGKAEKQYGAPREFVRFTEKTGEHEFWYYPDSGLALYFAPGSDEAKRTDYKPFEGLGDLQKAVVDTTVFPLYSGISTVAEAAYNFQLASYVDPTSIETYQNLAYVLSLLGRTDDAIRAAQRGLQIKPNDETLSRNLRAAVMARAQRLFNAKKYKEAIAAFYDAMPRDPANADRYQLRIADAWYRHAEDLGKGTPEQKVAYDSAATGYASVVAHPTASDSIKQDAMYNAIVIYANQEDYPKAVAMADKATALYANNQQIWSLAGQIKFQTNDFKGAVAVLTHALELDPQDASNHQFLFLSLNKLGDKESKERSVAEYTIYKALSQGTKKEQLKTWVDSADNRLGAANQLKTVLKTEGYPEEVYTYSEENKTFETWFFWSKGKSFTFMEGQIFSRGAFPPKKSS
jgi:tetratricopeptide (TPR) repeat protein